MRATQSGPVDPLYVIFEQHLYHFQVEEIEHQAFIIAVLEDYFSYLRKLKISIPKSLEASIAQELWSQVHVLLMKRIYGCLTLRDYQKGLLATEKRKVKARYSRLKSKTQGIK